MSPGRWGTMKETDLVALRGWSPGQRHDSTVYGLGYESFSKGTFLPFCECTTIAPAISAGCGVLV